MIEAIQAIGIVLGLIAAGGVIFAAWAFGCAVERRENEKKLGRKLKPGEYGASIDWWL